MANPVAKSSVQLILEQLETFGYNATDITRATNEVTNKNDINEIVDVMEKSKLMKSISYRDLYGYHEDETWIQLKDVPFRSHFLPFRGTILAISYKSISYWGDGIYIYNVDSDLWQKYLTYPDDFESINVAFALNKHKKELYGYFNIYNDKIMEIISLKKKTFVTKRIETNVRNFDCVSTVFINDKYHLFQGKQYRQHLILNQENNVFEFDECCKSLQLEAIYSVTRPWAVMYAQNKRMIIFGGDYDSWMKKVPLFCYEMKGEHVGSRWKKVMIELPNQIEIDHSNPRELSYCYHEQSENILIFDGLCGKHIYIVNINDFVVRLSDIQCPENKIYDVVFVSHMCENDKMVMGYARKHAGYQELPEDILNEIVNWMEGLDCIHLFDKNRGLFHWVIDVNSIIQ